MFKKLKASLGMGGGAEVETVLEDAETRPGETVRGTVTVRGGEVEQEVSHLDVALQATVEVEGEDAEWESDQVFARVRVSEGITLSPGEEQTFTFELPVPIETPFNVCDGYEMTPKVGVRTELEIARALDATDVDPLRVHALPVQEAVLGHIEGLGFPYVGSDLEKGKVQGSTLPFYQEVEYGQSASYAGLKQLEVTFLTHPGGCEVILEGDRKGGFLSEGGDSFVRFTLPLDATDVSGQVDAALRDLGRRRGLFG